MLTASVRNAQAVKVNWRFSCSERCASQTAQSNGAPPAPARAWQPERPPWDCARMQQPPTSCSGLPARLRSAPEYNPSLSSELGRFRRALGRQKLSLPLGQNFHV